MPFKLRQVTLLQLSVFLTLLCIGMAGLLERGSPLEPVCVIGLAMLLSVAVCYLIGVNQYWVWGSFWPLVAVLVTGFFFVTLAF